MPRPDHSTIFTTLQAIVDSAGVKYQPYTDNEDDTTYHCVDGKSIKFWNIFPYSGSRVDEMMFRANRYLQPFGLQLFFHIFSTKATRLVPVIVPQKDRPDARCQGYVEIPKFTLSLLVKPIPEGCK